MNNIKSPFEDDKITKKKKRLWIYFITFMLNFLAIVIIQLSELKELKLPVAITLLVFASILYLFLWRCPYCKGMLHRNIPRYCPNCGKKIF